MHGSMRFAGRDSVWLQMPSDYGIVRRPQKLATAAVSVGHVSNIGIGRAIPTLASSSGEITKLEASALLLSFDEFR